MVCSHTKNMSFICVQLQYRLTVPLQSMQCQRLFQFKVGNFAKNINSASFFVTLHNFWMFFAWLVPFPRYPIFLNLKQDNISDNKVLVTRFRLCRVEPVSTDRTGRHCFYWLHILTGLIHFSSENPPNESRHLLSGQAGTLAFNREVKMLFTANHENIGRLLGVCKERSSAVDCFITEYLEWVRDTFFNRRVVIRVRVGF